MTPTGPAAPHEVSAKPAPKALLSFLLVLAGLCMIGAGVAGYDLLAWCFVIPGGLFGAAFVHVLAPHL